MDANRYLSEEVRTQALAWLQGFLSRTTRKPEPDDLHFNDNPEATNPLVLEEPLRSAVRLMLELSAERLALFSQRSESTPR